MSECVRCKSKCKLPIFCNSCYQESFKSGERRGRVEELKYLVSLVHSDCTDCLATKKFLEERIKVLGGKP